MEDDTFYYWAMIFTVIYAFCGGIFVGRFTVKKDITDSGNDAATGLPNYYDPPKCPQKI